MDSNGEDFSAPEINLKRLLRKCELLEKDQQTDWRFDKYVEALQELFLSVKATADTAPKRSDSVLDRITTYKSRVDHLRRISRPDLFSEENDRKLLLDKRSLSRNLEPSQDTAVRLKQDNAVPGAGDSGASVVDFSAETTYPPIGSSYTRNTAAAETSKPSSRDLDILMAHEMERRERITDEMLDLTQTLKANMTTANQLVRRDFTVRQLTKQRQLWTKTRLV
ncbi:vesicle transport protein USE1-like isoform X2 [Paramacrobiotus metropolitanus]|uniref:vesicle transport protein USE1-like isoform X2 n=1 Tax=Paramacrobiotus metropolitanus TaxID=2943436 RepID=UPI0024463E27|nr:vesicle transport protein USE1-like isoform X2 [Paramacrobiotus metropolitanus]